MARLPTVLVAGGGNLYVELLDPFPPTVCSLVYVDSVEEALDQAADASLVVIEAKLPGGGMDLCRRLRSDKVTSHIPLILLVASKQEHVQALSDARVLTSDFAALVKSMRQLCPDLSGPPPEALSEEEALAEDEGWFDDGEQTVLYRRPEGDDADAGDWPPPPPERRVGQDMGDFAPNYSGYINSLIEALEDPSKLGAAGQARLSEMSTRTISDAERRLAEIQTAVMEALVGKDLDRMKLLSSAKNAIFDKLQRMKPLLVVLDATRASQPAPAAATSTTSSPALKSAPAKKSELTLAAEAKKAAREKEAKAKAKDAKEEARQKKPQKKTDAPPSIAYRATGGGALRKEERGTPVWLVVLAAVLVLGVIGGGGYYYFRSKSGPSVQGSNTAPAVKSVSIEQTPAGFVVRAQAEDPENDPITFVIRWFVNGQLVESERGVRLRADLYQPGNPVQAEVTPSDGTSSGAPARSPIVTATASGRPAPGPAPGPGPTIPPGRFQPPSVPPLTPFTPPTVPPKATPPPTGAPGAPAAPAPAAPSPAAPAPAPAPAR